MNICYPGDSGYVEPGSKEYCEVIGSSQVADILGFGYNSANDLWLSKTHRKPETEHKRIFDRGHAMEPHMAEMLRSEFGRALKAEQVQYRDPDRPWLIFHADGMFPLHTPLARDGVQRDGPGIWEAKAPGSHMADMMHREGMSQGYVCQMQIGMHVAGMAMGFPVMWGTASFLDYDQWKIVPFDVDADWGFQKAALSRLEAFYQCMVTDTPPEPINPSAAPQPPYVEGGVKTITDKKIIEVAEKLAILQHTLAPAKLMNDALREELKALLADYEAAEIPNLMKFSYKYSKAKEKIDGPGLLEYCQHLCGRLEIDFDRTQFVTPKAGVRTFRPTVIQEES